MPGVLAVVTAADLGLDDLGPAMPMFNASMKRPLLARDIVRFVGEPIVAIVTERREQGPDAAEAVFVDYDPLPAARRSARRAGTTRPSCSTRPAPTWCGRSTTTATPVDFSAAEVVVSQEMVNQRLAPSPIEGRSGAAWWEGDRLVQYQSCQGAHPVRDAIAEVYGLDQADVRVVCPDVGGSFGAKAGADARAARARRAVPPGGSAGALVRDPHREHGGHGPRPGPAPGRHARRHPRRPHHRLQARGRPGLRRLPGHGRGAAVHDPHDDHRRLRDGRRRVLRRQRRHHHHPARRLPRRRSARGGRRPRADGRPLRHRDRPRPGRGAPHQPAAARRVPVHDPDGHRVRQRRLRQGARPGARDRRLRRAAGRTGGAAGGRRPHAPRHRHGRLRRGDRRRGRVRRGPAAPRRHRSWSRPARTPTARATTPPGRCW